MKLRRPELFPNLAKIQAEHSVMFRAQTQERYRHIAIAAAMLVALLLGYGFLGFTPLRFINGLVRFGAILARMMPPSPGSWEHFWLYMDALAQTLGLALIGVFGSALIALPLALLAARNVTGSQILHIILRRLFDMIRTIDRFIWALIFVRAVGLGPFAGALALLVSNIGTLGKVFSETIEATDQKPVEGVLSSGGTGTTALRFGIIPQAIPVITGQLLYYFESDTRSATIIGIVGAGGIGLTLYEEIRTLEWTHVAFLLIMIVITVALIDILSAYLRRTLARG